MEFHILLIFRHRDGMYKSGRNQQFDEVHKCLTNQNGDGDTTDIDNKP